jgi:hypothetical protein
MYASCIENCVDEGWGEDLCRRNCDCHSEVIRRGLTDEEVERMLEIAIQQGKGHERIRAWLRETALECRRKVIGKTGTKSGKPTE